MKKSRFVIPILLTTLMTSCTSWQEIASETLSSSREAVSKLVDSDKSHYSLEIVGHVCQFDTFDDHSRNYSVPSNPLSPTSNRSYVLRAPLVMTKDSYYLDEDSTDQMANPDNYIYNRLITRLEWTNDPTCKMRFRTEGDNLVFYVTGLSKRLSFYHLVTHTDPEIVSEVSVYARFDITLTYSNQGHLLTEKIVSQTPDTTDFSKTIDVLSTYTYS